MGGMISTLLGTSLPGRGTNWLKQKFSYSLPAYPGEEITAWVKIVRLRPEKDLVNLRTWCTNYEHQVLCDGMALVLVKDIESNENRT
jgi:acyl dehydratase